MNKPVENMKFSKGETLFTEKPFVYVLNCKLAEERCDHCFKRGELLTCTGCKQTRYCDRICQKNGWYFHRRECTKIKNFAPNILPEAGRTMARIMFKIEKGHGNEKSFYSPHQFRTLKDLMSHFEEGLNDSRRMDGFQEIYDMLTVFFGNEKLPSQMDLLYIYGKIIINTFCITDGEMRSIGKGLYLGASILNHSCDANALAVFEGTTLHLRTLVDIPQLDWNNVFVTYINPLKLTDQRQVELQEAYYFLCQCRKCLDVEELELMTSTICQKCGGTVPGGSKNFGAKCTKCKKPVSNADWEKILRVLEIPKLLAEETTYSDVCQLGIKRQDGLLHPMNLRHVQTLNTAMAFEEEDGELETAIQHGRSLIEPFRRYYGYFHPHTGILFLRLGKIASALDNFQEAREHFNEALKILKVTHGSQHSFVKETALTIIRNSMS